MIEGVAAWFNQGFQEGLDEGLNEWLLLHIHDIFCTINVTKIFWNSKILWDIFFMIKYFNIWKKTVVARGLLGLFTHVCTSLSGFATFLSWGHLILFCYSVVPLHCKKTTDIFNIVSLVSLIVGPKKQDFYHKWTYSQEITMSDSLSKIGLI